MRDKWYGDKRDYVKWSVLLQLASQYGASRVIQVAYYRPETLDKSIEIDGHKYLMPDAVIRHLSRNVMDIERLIHSGVEIKVFNSPLSDRETYLRKVLVELPALSVHSPCIIFLDPDTGLEPKKPLLEHVLESEIAEIWNAMRANDVLVFYQHATTRNAKKGRQWVEPKRRQVESALGVGDGAAKTAHGEAATDVAFFLCTKRPRLFGPTATPNITSFMLDDPHQDTENGWPVLRLPRPNRHNLPAIYAVRIDSALSPEIAACAAASRAIGTRYGEHET